MLWHIRQYDCVVYMRIDLLQFGQNSAYYYIECPLISYIEGIDSRVFDKVDQNGL